MQSITVIYVYHNCFLVECGGHVFVFDYPAAEYRPPEAEALVRRYVSGRYAVFCISHSHADHCSADVLKLAASALLARFVVSYDVAELVPEFAPDTMAPGTVLVVEPDQEGVLDDIRVSGLESTDMGVGFAITLQDYSPGAANLGPWQGLRLYFGGDVALWDWEGQHSAQKAFNLEHFDRTLDQVRAFAPHVAFSNADHRLASHSGAREFMQRVRPGLFVPMHCFGETQHIREFGSLVRDLDVPIFLYSRPGESSTVTLPVRGRTYASES